MTNSIKINELTIRKATINDLSRIVQMLSDDTLGKDRDVFSLPLAINYYRAFEIINSNPETELLVVQYDDLIIGTAQVDYLTHLSYEGGRRAQIESVRIDKKYRSLGIGQKLIEAIIAKAKKKNCHLVQLTTNKQRQEAKHFYEKLGFVASHEGMKLLIK